MILLVVDGSNAVMRAAYGGDIPPQHSTPVATTMIEKAAKLCQATHLIIALDCPHETPTWRKTEYPAYKATRTRDTGPWIDAASHEWTKLGWFVENQAGYEADDIIATVATRAKGRADTFIYSSDSDLLPLTELGATIIKPEKGGPRLLKSPDVCQLKNVATPGALVDVKAMTGDSGDNIAGVPGIGEVRATRLLRQHTNLEGVLAEGKISGCDKYAALVAQYEVHVLIARKLITLCSTVPLPLIQPAECRL